MVSWSVFIIKVLLISISIGLIASHFITVSPIDMIYQVIKNPEIMQFLSGAVDLGNSFVQENYTVFNYVEGIQREGTSSKLH